MPSPGDLSNPGMEPASLMSPALAGKFFTTSAPGNAAVEKKKKRKKSMFKKYFKHTLKSMFIICEIGKTNRISVKNCKLKSLRFSCSESDFSFQGYILFGVWTEVFTWPCCILGGLIRTAGCWPICVCCVLGVYQKTSLVFSLSLWWI